MANVSHASLTGSEVHEPKGITGAALGTVYVSNGAGSGSWSSVGTSAFTGMIADFAAPVAPAGWLELDGSVVSTATYAALYAVMSLTTSGTRTNGSPIITSIPDTSALRAGYYVFGTGISSGTTILSVDSASQITISTNASSPGSSAIAVSPFLLNTGTIKLPDMTTAGRYRRSRTSGMKVGDALADQNQAHTHTYSSTTGAAGAHNHSLTDPGHNHSASWEMGLSTGTGDFPPRGVTNSAVFKTVNVNTNTTGITLAPVTDHTHSVSGTTASTGSAEARPLTLVVMTCIKT